MKKQEQAKNQAGVLMNKNMIIGIAVVAVLIIAGIIYFSMNGKIIPPNSQQNSQTPGNPNVASADDENKQVIVLQSSREVDKYDSRRQSIVGKVKNNGSTLVQYVEITASLYNINNKLVKTEVTRPVLNDLDAGQVSPFTFTDIFEPFTSYELEVNWTQA